MALQYTVTSDEILAYRLIATFRKTSSEGINELHIDWQYLTLSDIQVK